MSDSAPTPPTMTRDDVIRSTADHIRRVGNLLVQASNALAYRAVNHDASKWSAEEWPAFERTTPKLASLTYGSDEYKAQLREIKPSIEQHYRRNRHHPEYHPLGIRDMNLLDLIEMLCDWKAATERHNDGNLAKSIVINAGRFKYDKTMIELLGRTAVALDLITEDAFEDVIDPAIAAA